MLASIIIISKNEGYMLKRTVDNLLTVRCSTACEIIVVDDGSTDGSSTFLDGRSPYAEVRCMRTSGLGIAVARNLGATHAKGDVFVFCDAHILVEDNWLDILLDAMRSQGAQAATPTVTSMRKADDFSPPLNIIGAARSAPLIFSGCGKGFASPAVGTWLTVPASVEEVPVLSGICTVMEKTLFEVLNGFGSHFRGYGWEEEELSMKLWMFGYRLIGVPHTSVQHLFRASAPYIILPEDFYRNLLYMALCHYKQERTDTLMRELVDIPYIRSLYEELQNNPAVLETREKNHRSRLYNDDWYAHKFGLPI